jgi:hypothetical protein
MRLAVELACRILPRQTTGKYTTRQIIAIIIFTTIALISIFYWLTREPEKPETPVQIGYNQEK